MFFISQNRNEANEKFVEEPGFEPGAFRMRSGHSTTELHPLHTKDPNFIGEINDLFIPNSHDGFV